jgi:hypothetical protein
MTGLANRNLSNRYDTIPLNSFYDYKGEFDYTMNFDKDLKPLKFMPPKKLEK